MNPCGIVIAGTGSGTGKTTITMGIILALKKRGLKIQPYKSGPDYIDPGFHSFASGNNCRNLDSMLLSESKIKELYLKHSRGSDISLIEGVMGLFDGAFSEKERGSTAHLSRILKLPVIVVINAKAMAQSAGAIALGFKEFDRDVRIAGFILNRIGSKRHYKIVRDSIEKATGSPVLGYLPGLKLKIPERHLGLTPSWENSISDDFIHELRLNTEKHIDTDRILEIAKKAGKLDNLKKTIFVRPKKTIKIKIAYACDKAFSFYYSDNLDILEYNGAELYPCSPMEDKKIPENVDGLYIGGGFPELYAEKLSSNKSFFNDINEKVKHGMPVYAECGGLIYLTRRLKTLEGRDYPMAGLLPGRAVMRNHLKTMGYCEIKQTKDTVIGKKDDRIKGHIFHWSEVEDIPDGYNYAFRVKKGDKIMYDGLTVNNLLASYIHIHFATDINIARNFIRKCHEYNSKKS